jgi:hypothetical protein
MSLKRIDPDRNSCRIMTAHEYEFEDNDKAIGRILKKIFYENGEIAQTMSI